MTVYDHTFDLGEGQNRFRLPLRAGLYPLHDTSTPIRIEAVGQLDDHQEVSRSATLSFVHGQKVVVVLPLWAVCKNVECKLAYATCKANGNCESDAVEGSDLPKYVPNQPVSGTDAFNDIPDARVLPVAADAAVDALVDAAADNEMDSAATRKVDLALDMTAEVGTQPGVEPATGAEPRPEAGTDTGTDTAPIRIDTAPIDAPKALDTGAVDTFVAIDSAPVCTMTTPFRGGNVTADLTLPVACSPFTIADDIRVEGNATLTIEAGAVLRFQPDVSISIGYGSAGKIVAVGTAASPITFTSANTTPGPGDWAGIVLWSNTMNGTTLAYAKFDYCGSYGDACILGEGAKPNRVSIDHVTIAHVGSTSDGINQKDVDSNFAISNCTFSGISSTPTQQYAISVCAPSFAGIDATNTFGGNAMVQLMGGDINAGTTWKNLGTTVAVTDDIRVEGASTPTLTIPAGSVFKFAAGTGVRIGYSNPGSLIVNGTATSKVTFTSLNATPVAGDWVGIVVWTGSASLRYTTIDYAGWDTGAVSVVGDATTLDVQSCTLSNSASYGIGIPCGSTATVTNTGNLFANNATGNVGPGPDITAVACQ